MLGPTASGSDQRQRMGVFLNRFVPFVLAIAVIAAIALYAVARPDSDPVGAPQVYVALGASDAIGVGATRPAVEGWVPLVHAALPRDTHLVNLGVNGASLAEILALEVPVAVSAKPSLVTVWPGVNDLRGGVDATTFDSRLNELLSKLSVGRTRIVIANIPDLRLLRDFMSVDPVILDATVRAWNAIIARRSEQYGATLVDLYGGSLELEQHPEYISDDGLHPSSAGYRRIADLVLDALDVV